MVGISSLIMSILCLQTIMKLGMLNVVRRIVGIPNIAGLIMNLRIFTGEKPHSSFQYQETSSVDYKTKKGAGRTFWHPLNKFLAIMGPAWLVMIADVDVASIITGIESGALFKYCMIFIELILIIPLFIIQDAAGRVGSSTNKGIGELVRENFGKNIALLTTLPMAFTDFLSYAVEYAGIALGLNILELPIFPWVIVIFLLHLFIVMSRKYVAAEKLLLILSGFFLLFVIFLGFASRPDYYTLITEGFSPFQPYSDSAFDFLIIANIGAVIMPWMIFFQAGSASEKKLTHGDLKYERLETFIGAVVSELMMIGLIIVGACFNDSSLTPSIISSTLQTYGSLIVFIFGLTAIISGFFALIIISLGSSWSIVESLGFKRYSKQNSVIYVLESLPALVLTLLIPVSINYILNLMVVFVFVLLAPAVLLGVIVGNNTIMHGFAYNKWEKRFYWTTTLVIELSGIIGMLFII